MYNIQCKNTHRRLVCGCPVVSGKGMGLWWPAAGLGARTVAVHAWDLLRSPLSSLHPPWFGPRSIAGREHSSTHQQKIGLRFTEHGSQLIRRRPSFPLSQSLPSGSFLKPLILLHKTESHSHRKLTNLITWTTALSNSMKL